MKPRFTTRKRPIWFRDINQTSRIKRGIRPIRIYRSQPAHAPKNIPLTPNHYGIPRGFM